MKGAKPRFFSLQEGMYNGHLWHFSEVNNSKSYKFLMYANNTELMGDSIFVLLPFVKLTQAKVTWKGKTSIEELP